MGEKKKDLVTGENQATARQRDAHGRFVKGTSGNPRGRPKSDEEIKEALKLLVPRAVEVLREIIENPGARDQDRIRAIEVVFDRVFGRPAQEVKLEDIDTTVRIIDADPEGAEYNG